jgi:hypothetical protein
MRRHTFKAAADDDSLPVIIPRNDKAVVPISPERVRRLRKHLVLTLRALRTMKGPEHSVSPLRPEPEGFAGHVARTACSLCKGWCCRNGEDHAFLDEGTIARVRCASLALDVRSTLRLYVERVPEVGSGIHVYFTENKAVRWTGRCGPMCATATSVVDSWLI